MGDMGRLGSHHSRNRLALSSGCAYFNSKVDIHQPSQWLGLGDALSEHGIRNPGFLNKRRSCICHCHVRFLPRLWSSRWCRYWRNNIPESDENKTPGIPRPCRESRPVLKRRHELSADHQRDARRCIEATTPAKLCWCLEDSLGYNVRVERVGIRAQLVDKRAGSE